MNVVIVDYGFANVGSLRSALGHLNQRVTVYSTWRDLDAADALILPGVGTFGNAMDFLCKEELVESIRSFSRERTVIGICLGMQLLFEEGTEAGTTDGIGILAGKVVKIPNVKGAANRKTDVTRNIGWRRLRSTGAANGIRELDRLLSEAFYFLHSFYASDISPAVLMATVDVDTVSVPAIVGSGKVVGFQFHPEKSGNAGLNLLSNVLPNEVRSNA